MADCNILAPFIMFWEGGIYVNDPNDSGGPTMKGVTLNTFRSFFGASKTVDDLKKITDEQWTLIFKSGFWNKCKADDIKCQSIANMIVDWAYNAGALTVIKRIQRLVGVTADGIVGPKTLAAINSKNSRSLFYQLHNDREAYYRSLSKFKIYGNGWLNRNNSIHFSALDYSGACHSFKES